MAGFKNIVVFVVLSALLVAVCLGQNAQGGPHVSQGGPNVSQGGPHVSQGGPHQSQGRARRQVSQNPGDIETNRIGQNPLNWTTCDPTVIPKISCHDCNTRVICKPVGGLLKACDNPARPHCNLGICSAVPSASCA